MNVGVMIMNKFAPCRGSAGEGEWRKYSWKDVFAGDHPHPEQVRSPASCFDLLIHRFPCSTVCSSLECCNCSPIIHQDKQFPSLQTLKETMRLN